MQTSIAGILGMPRPATTNWSTVCGVCRISPPGVTAYGRTLPVSMAEHDVWMQDCASKRRDWTGRRPVRLADRSSTSVRSAPTLSSTSPGRAFAAATSPRTPGLNHLHCVGAGQMGRAGCEVQPGAASYTQTAGELPASNEQETLRPRIDSSF